MSQQQRMLLAVGLSLLFFIAYDFIIPKPQRVMLDQNATHTSQQVSQANTVAPIAPTDTMGQAPVTTNNSAPTTVNSAPTVQSNIISTVKSKDFIAQFDELGRISKFEVLIERFKNSKDGSYPNVIPNNALKPLEIRFSDHDLNVEAFKVSYSANVSQLDVSSSHNSIVLTQKLSKTTVTKTISFNENGSYTINVKLSNNQEYFMSPGFRPDIEADMYTFKGVLIRKANEAIEKVADGDAEGNEVFNGATVLSASDKYYTTTFYDFDNSMNSFLTKDANDDPLAFVKGSSNFSVNGYVGPKEYDRLESIDPRLTSIIEYGFFTFISKPLFIFLKYIHSIVGNWGWSIVLITLIIRLILYPLTYKGMVSMNKLKELSPKIKQIQADNKGNPQKTNAKMMELYKKEGANPMGGCLPMLMQIPVFFAIYRVLLNTIELKHSPWMGWIHDLSVMDPYYVLPILMGASMFWQQRITPTNFTDPMQEKIMKFLPLIFTFFFVTFPAGLTLYWFVNNMFSVLQQYYVNSIFAKAKAKKEATKEVSKS